MAEINKEGEMGGEGREGERKRKSRRETGKFMRKNKGGKSER